MSPRRPPGLHAIVAGHLPLLALLLSGCGGSGDAQDSPTSASSKPATPSSAPSYSSAQLRGFLLTAEEVGASVREVEVQFFPFKNRKAPLCSLSEWSLPRKPELTFRQFANRSEPKDEIRYVQLVARYSDEISAADAYEQLTKKARACPAEQHVPARKIRKNFTLFPHDDTWRVSEDNVHGWKHLRGLEKQTVPRGYTKFNVLHYMYDYVQRGNVLLATVYWERTEPGKSGDPTAKNATAVLNRQLQKIR